MKSFSCTTDDPCIRATCRTYTELKRLGLDEAGAFSAAVRVLRAHHPDLGLDEAYDTAAAWIDGGNIGLAAHSA